MVAFAGCRVGIDSDCPPEPSNQGKKNSVVIVGAPSDDADALKTAVEDRPLPSELSPFTCISCGLETAYGMLSHPFYDRPDGVEAKPLFLVVTDGDQTVFGTNQVAINAADSVKANGVDVVSISIGDALQTVMDAMASDPPTLYSRTAATVQELINQAEM